MYQRAKQVITHHCPQLRPGDLGVKVDANRSAINALGVQTAARFDRLEQHVNDGFTEFVPVPLTAA